MCERYDDAIYIHNYVIDEAETRDILGFESKNNKKLWTI